MSKKGRARKTDPETERLRAQVKELQHALELYTRDGQFTANEWAEIERLTDVSD